MAARLDVAIACTYNMLSVKLVQPTKKKNGANQIDEMAPLTE